MIKSHAGMEQADPNEILRNFLSQIHAALDPLKPFFEVMGEVVRTIDRSRPSP